MGAIWGSDGCVLDLPGGLGKGLDLGSRFCVSGYVQRFQAYKGLGLRV